MQHKHCFEAVHCTLYNIYNDHEALFDDLPAVLDGDFTQIFLVVKNENHASIVNVCLQQSALWRQLKKLALLQNMRLQRQGTNTEFV